MTNRISKPVGLLLRVFVLVALASNLSTPAPRVAGAQSAPPRPGFPSYNPAFGPPPGWTGPLFQLSQNYPKELPKNEKQPWKQYDFRTQPREYMLAVRSYVYEGNLDRGEDASGNSLDWVVQKNPVRTWYHMPWRDYGPRGREFIHGMTLEFPSSPGSLQLTQKKTANTYAIAMYNPIAGYAVGQVWPDPAQGPSMKNFVYPEGALIAKLLFTTALASDVPEVEGAFHWKASVYKHTDCTNPGCPREIRTVRLFQMDAAIKDSRASKTGWVFMTFVYNYDQTGAKSVWEKMVPLGLMWGLDPQLTSADTNGKPRESITFNMGLYEHLGCHGRLSGPLDNPNSACMSCHLTSQYPGAYPLPSKAYLCDAPQNAQYWQDLQAGAIFQQQSEPTFSLDYSQELANAVQNFFMSKGNATVAPDGKTYTLGNSKTVYHVIRRQD